MKKRIISWMLVASMLLALTPGLALDVTAAGIPEDAAEFNGSFYKIFNDSMTWTEAKAYCEELGGRLVTITSQAESDYLVELLASAEKNCYWIGVQYIESDGHWELVNGGTVPFFNWAPNEPNFFEGNQEYYVHLFGKRYTGGKGIKEVGHWNDVTNEGAAYANEFYALKNFGFICEWGEETVISIDDLVEYKGHYYKLYYHSETWEDARDYCESLGGHLATITSQEENDFLYDFITSCGVTNAYFGLSDATEEEFWRWTTGETLEYTNWNSGEPNNESSNEDYAMFYCKYGSGTWNDGNYGQGTAGDNYPIYFICEWDSEPNSDEIVSVETIDVSIPYSSATETLPELPAKYSDAYFAGSSYNYRSDLAWLTLCLELSAWTADESSWGESGSDSGSVAATRYANIESAYSQIGFDDVVYYNYGTTLNDTSDKVAYSIATKNDVCGATLVAVAIRGGGYGGEWSSNFHVGDGSSVYHNGFNNAAESVYEEVLRHLEQIDGRVKLWVTGYSRGAATANLLAAKLDTFAAISGQYDADDVFVYTFATPQGVTDRKDASAPLYDNIFNIVNPGDVVPLVAPSGWGFTRYGITRSFDRNASSETLDAVDSAYWLFTGRYSYYAKSDLRQSASGSALMRIILKAFPDTESAEAIQKVLQEFLEYTNTKKFVADASSSGSWEPIEIVDFYEVLIDRYGDDYVIAMYMVHNFLTYSGDGLLLMSLIGDNKEAEDFVYLFLSLCEVHGFDCSEVSELVASLLTSDNIWSALEAFLNMSDGLSGVGMSHTPAVYLSWMALKEASAFGNTAYSNVNGTTVVKVSCPVDVTVYDESGAVLAEIADHELISAEIPVIVSGETTELYFAATEEEYTIEIVPYDGGSMTYTVTELDASNEVRSRVNYYDVPVAVGQTFTGTFETGTDYTDGKYDLQCTDDTGVTRISADEILTGDDTVKAELTIAGNGNAVGGGTYLKGESVVFKAYHAPSSAFAGWYVNGELFSNDDVLQMQIMEDVEVEALFVTNNPFTDVVQDTYYHDPVLWALDRYITTGTTATTFSPGSNCQRAQIVTFLWRAKGCPEPTSDVNPFVDVNDTDFYYKAVLWAVENGITNGVDATHFKPYEPCNRAQVVTFLWRAEGEPEVQHFDNIFTDVQSGAFYEKPVLWAVENGVTNGLSATAFGPNSICNRAQIVTFLYRAFVND